jgi:hypothetical protein
VLENVKIEIDGFGPGLRKGCLDRFVDKVWQVRIHKLKENVNDCGDDVKG